MPTPFSRAAVPAVLGLLIVFLTPALVGASLPHTLGYLVWTASWWVLGYALVTLRGRRGTFLDLSLGAVVGVICQLGGWALSQAMHLPSWTVVGGVLAALVGGSLLWRSQHRDVRQGRGSHPMSQELDEPRTAGPLRAPAHVVWTWAILTAWMAFVFAGFAKRQTLPPGTSTMYQDLYWHLGLVGELKHALIPQVPQADVGRLNYHWLSDAYMASGSLGAFVPAGVVTLLLWVLPVVALTFALCAVVGLRISGSWVTGNVAMLLLAAPASVAYSGWMGGGPSTPFLWLSPSQIFGLPFTLWALYLFVPVLRGQRPARLVLALMAVTVFLCAGAKSSILPVFLGGAATTFFVFVRRRPQRRGALTVGALCLLGIVAALPLFAGGSAGSKIRLFSSVRRAAAYREATGLPISLNHGPFILPYIATPTVFLVTVGVLVAVLIGYAYAASSATLGRRWREDPVPTFLLGSFVASLGAYELIDHTGMSQGYFPMGALPLLALLSGWGVATAWEGKVGGRWSAVVGGVAVGAVFVLLMRYLTGGHVPTHHLARNTDWPLIVMLGVLALVILLMRRRALLMCGLLLGAACAHQVWVTGKDAGGALMNPPMAAKAWSVLPAESAAAFWLRDHSTPDALVATNVHCRNIRSTRDCDRRAFWVSAFGERRMLVESWGYTDGVQKLAGRGGLRATSQPYPDQKLYQLNESVFHAPTAVNVAALKAAGVSWLYGDARASAVSPDLARFATLEHSDGPVRIYHLR